MLNSLIFLTGPSIFRAWHQLPPLTGPSKSLVVERYSCLLKITNKFRVFVTKQTLLHIAGRLSPFISARNPSDYFFLLSLPSRLPFPVTLWLIGSSGSSSFKLLLGYTPITDAQNWMYLNL